MGYVISALIGELMGIFIGYVFGMAQGHKVKDISEDDWEDK